MRWMVKGAVGSLGILAALMTQVYAAGYRLEFQSPAVLADAGDAAVIDDASTNWYNSAGLPFLPQQLVISGIDVYAPTTFSGTAVAPNLLNPSLPPFVGTGSASSHTNSFLPAIHYALPVDKYWSFGLSIVPAWGFIEDYGDSSLVRYDIIRIYTKTIDVAPSVAWRMNNNWSFGFGPDFHYFSVQSRSALNTDMTFHTPSHPFNFIDSIDHYSASNWSNGAHLGMLFSMDNFRLGLNYRSKINMRMEGYSDFDGAAGQLPPPNFHETSNFKLRLALPPVTTLSAYWAMSPCLAFMGTLSYEQWSVIQAYYAENFATLPSSRNVSLRQGFSNTWDFGVGTHYALSEQFMLRGSIKYVATPTTTAYRDPLFPDGSKIGLQIGAHYQYNHNIGFDGIYGHVFVKEVGIHGFNPVTQASTSGHSSTHIDLLGAQLVWTVC